MQIHNDRIEEGLKNALIGTPIGSAIGGGIVGGTMPDEQKTRRNMLI